jgi:hypothetical protein
MRDLEQAIREQLRAAGDRFDPNESLPLPLVRQRARVLRTQALVSVLVVALVAAAGIVIGTRTESPPRNGSFVEQTKKEQRTNESNIAKARAEIASQFDHLRLPDGSREQATSPVASLASGPPERLGAANFIFSTRWWTVPLPVVSAYNWIRAHPPTGMRISSEEVSVTTSGPVKSLIYADPETDAYEVPWLMLSVARLSNGTSAVRADGSAVWLTSTPRRVGDRGPSVRVTIDAGCPSTLGNYEDVANPDDQDLSTSLLPQATPTAAMKCLYKESASGGSRYVWTLNQQLNLSRADARALARTINGLRLGFDGGGPMSCPAILTGTRKADVFVFSYSGRADVDLWHNYVCPVSVDNGIITTSLFSPGLDHLKS